MSNEWIEWSGGECPVGADVMVQCRLRSPFGWHKETRPAKDWAWDHSSVRPEADIVAYRIAGVAALPVKIKKLHPDAVLPKYATAGAACFDLAALEGGYISWEEALAFRTGLSFEVPEGHAMLIFSRSGHGFKNDVRLSNCVGVIDSDYRGEVQVKLRNDSSEMDGFSVRPGDRIAQAMILPVQQVQFIEAEELSGTERGEGGFGSTGK